MTTKPTAPHLGASVRAWQLALALVSRLLTADCHDEYLMRNCPTAIGLPNSESFVRGSPDHALRGGIRGQNRLAERDAVIGDQGGDRRCVTVDHVEIVADRHAGQQPPVFQRLEPQPAVKGNQQVGRSSPGGSTGPVARQWPRVPLLWKHGATHAGYGGWKSPLSIVPVDVGCNKNHLRLAFQCFTSSCDGVDWKLRRNWASLIPHD